MTVGGVATADKSTRVPDPDRPFLKGGGEHKRTAERNASPWGTWGGWDRVTHTSTFRPNTIPSEHLQLSSRCSLSFRDEMLYLS